MSAHVECCYLYESVHVFSSKFCSGAFLQKSDRYSAFTVSCDQVSIQSVFETCKSRNILDESKSSLHIYGIIAYANVSVNNNKLDEALHFPSKLISSNKKKKQHAVSHFLAPNNVEGNKSATSQ